MTHRSLKWWHGMCLLAMGGLPLSSSAFEIDSMYQVMNREGTASFIIKNSEDYRIFVGTSVNELHFDEQGAMNKVPYSRDNIGQWALDVFPARAIIEPGLEKVFEVTMRCELQCDYRDDQVYQVAFVPVPYREGVAGAVSQMAVGFGPYVVYPGKGRPQLDAVVNYQGTTLTVFNHSPHVLTTRVSACQGALKDECKRTLTVLGGRSLSFSLPEPMQTPSLTLTYSDVRGKAMGEQQVLRRPE